MNFIALLLLVVLGRNLSALIQPPLLIECFCRGLILLTIKKGTDTGVNKIVGAISFQIIPADTQYVEVPLAVVDSVY
ncbi:hypothetical protein L2E82_17689 [Cichorium intybus]|uniref:Uncharacterized protein n=1 Tax=Cichorium intybus TaxID=13427 RepID=A0ACB9F8E4_CICIN|nr:hypothetical protein L2E82_17689 [Cichorium intybus]